MSTLQLLPAALSKSTVLVFCAGSNNARPTSWFCTDNDGEGEGQGEGEGEGEEGEATTAGAGEEDTLASGAEGVLQLAWEVLECARLIYSKDPAKTRDLAQVYIKLGEHGQITGVCVYVCVCVIVRV